MPKLLDQTSMTGIRSLVTPLYVCEFMMILSFHLCTKKNIFREKKSSKSTYKYERKKCIIENMTS
jgi:hypothetical protein